VGGVGGGGGGVGGPWRVGGGGGGQGQEILFSKAPVSVFGPVQRRQWVLGVTLIAYLHLIPG